MPTFSFMRCAITALAFSLTAFFASAQPTGPLERLQRGLVAIKQFDDTAVVSWRLLGTDPTGTSFNLYRVAGTVGPVKLNSAPLAGPTFFSDEHLPAGPVSYFVRPVWRGKEFDPSASFSLAADAPVRPYLEIPLQVPPGGTTPSGEAYTYSANDGSIGDVDGDGVLEFFLKWVPSNAKDNSHGGYTGNTLLDCYRFDGTRLWRIDLGKNIRSGAHYTQFIVYDFDGDGKAELACKTGDGTIDGIGKVIGDAKADHRNDGGYILRGPEFLTVFNGLTGAAIDTVDYVPGRHPETQDPTSAQLKAEWGDGYGNRFDRFNAAAASLDGKTASLIEARGYYTRTVISAWDLRGGKLVKRWTFDTNVGSGNRAYAGQGNHQISIADVDGDGKDEIVYGAMVLDDDGKGLHSTGLGHGDALHVGDLDPTRAGLEIFDIQERFDDAGMHFRDAKSGRILWKKPSVKAGDDGEGPGRGNAFDIDPRYPGAECWVKGAGIGGLFDAKGRKISDTAPGPCNFGVWWDGDAQSELLDRNRITKWNGKDSSEERILTAEGCDSNNGTKATPVLSGDILGDWREEVVWRTDDSSALRIYVTTIPTKYRLTTLLHDRQYRFALAWQNVGYNQPPHPSFDMETRLRAQR
ncbi:MAG: rhamnogalacturonan lyase [Rariglobus sp.]|nr:rhamnogalacturonan lyase [Rariglobus sp.]